MASQLFKMQANLACRISELPTKLAEQCQAPSDKLIDAALSTLHAHWEDFRANDEKLLSEPGIEGTDYRANDQFTTTQMSYLLGIDHLESMRPAPQTVPNQLPADAVPLPVAMPPVPKVTLPEFSGAYLEWEAFRDAFESTVVSRNDVPAVQKLILLKQSLNGQAALLVRNVSSIAANFDPTWKAVCARYANKRLLVRAHLTAFLTMEKVRTNSADDLRALLDQAHEKLRSLEQLDRPVVHWDDLVVQVLLDPLDTTSRQQWEFHLTNLDAQRSLADPAYVPDVATRADLETFLEARLRALEMGAPNTSAHPPATQSLRPMKTSRTHQTTTWPTNPSSSRVCAFCRESHPHFTCPAFRQMSPPERLSAVKRHQLCFNCLGTHSKRQCLSKRSCQLCQQRHNSLLHESFDAAPPQQGGGDDAIRHPVLPASSSHVINLCSREETPMSSTLMTTALVSILSPTGARYQTRALLDSASDVSLVSEDVVQRLGLTRCRSSLSIVGVGANKTAHASHHTEVQFTSVTTPEEVFRVRAYVLPRLSSEVPSESNAPIDPRLLCGLKLADPEYFRAKKIGLLLGAKIFGLLFRQGIIRVPDHPIVALNTALGWVLTGSLTTPAPQVSTFCCQVVDNLDQAVRRFWETEELPALEPSLPPEDEDCELQFQSNYSRDETGRFMVRLPRRAAVEHGDNRSQAVQALLSMERRLSRDDALHQSYVGFMAEYESLQHMQKVENTADQPTWYLPHHGVIQAGPKGKKLRVVFDASRKNHNGRSLNQFLHAGPPLLNDLTLLLLKWRNFRFVFSADIVKMFRQVLVHPEDRSLQRIVWRPNSASPIVDYELQTVTYGTACAPYLAIRVLRKLAEIERDHFPLGAECLMEDSYVDDVLSGADSLQLAIDRRDELIGLLSGGQFELGKWVANHSDLLPGPMSVSDDTGTTHKVIKLDDSTKMLGIWWNPARDAFLFSCRPMEQPKDPPTMRIVLARVAQLFDPMGWIAPVIVVAKILIQDLWLAKCGWDNPLADPFAFRWDAFQRNLPHLQDVAISRWTRASNNVACELHGFADASQRAYAAVVYARVTESTGETHSSLLMAKTKNAPTSTCSIPRLELCAAQLLVRLLQHVRKVPALGNCPMTAWSDSAVALAWIQGHPSRWKTFVANRVSHIQTSLPELGWRHVPGSENPADLASRGTTPQILAVHPQWWNGPSWLCEPPESWPSSKATLSNLPEEKINRSAQTLHTHAEDDFSLLTRYSSLSRTLRIAARCVHYWRHCLSRSPPAGAFITPADIADAKVRLIRCVQQSEFTKELTALRRSGRVPESSSIADLSPFLDKRGLLCVGGRLDNALLPETEKHPPILPKSAHLSRLFVHYAHASVLHGGLALTTSFLRKHVWIVHGRALAKFELRRCVTCRRHRAELGHQQMGQLPAVRVTPSRPFARSGVDYAGPILCRTSPGRGQPSRKSYIALFVCLATKAVHLEAVSDLTTAAFLAAFRRFTARRGLCSEMFSDNGTNFVGADNELRALFRDASSFYHDVAATLADSGTLWKFIPPSSPHFGGLWESGVKSTKGLLKKIIGEQKLTYEELSTVLAQVEACLNSRPLVPLSSDISDLSVLTPAHFLVGSSLLTVPEPPLPENEKVLSSRWRLLQQMVQHFWRKWSAQYLSHLQQRTRWRGTTANFPIGQLVLVRNPLLPPGKWSLGRVTCVHPGIDGLVRVVTVKTATNELRRPITQLSPLPVEPVDAAASTSTSQGANVPLSAR